MLDFNEFTNGLHAVDDYYSIEMYENIYDSIVYHMYYDDDDEDNYETLEINQSMYELIGVDNNNEICLAFGCGFPYFEEVDSNKNSMIDKNEFVNKMLSIDPSGFEVYNSTFDEISGDDGLVDNAEYEEFLHDYDDSYDNDEYEVAVDYSDRDAFFQE